MFVLRVLLLSLRLFAAEPEYDEPPIEPEVIHLDIPWRQKLSVEEVIINPYEDIYPEPPPLPLPELTESDLLW